MEPLSKFNDSIEKRDEEMIPSLSEFNDSIEKRDEEMNIQIEEIIEKLHNDKNTFIDPKNEHWDDDLNNTFALITDALEMMYIVIANKPTQRDIEFALTTSKYQQQIMQHEYKIAELEKRLEYYTKKGGSNKLYKNIKTIKNRFKRNI